MNQEQLLKLQEIELEITNEIFRLCDKHNLKVALTGGSCLGAIRHQGVIPWDDDVDLAMPRDDYDKFVEICKTELNDKYFFQHFLTEDNCGYVFGKVRKNGTRLTENYSYHMKMHQGIWVDIFPYDNVSDSSSTRAWDFRRVQFYKYLLIVKCGFKMPENRSKLLSIFYYCAKFASIFFPKKFLKKRLYTIMTRHRNEKTTYIYPYGGAYNVEKELMPNDFFNDLITVKFNQYEFKTFKEYDHYLSNLYGDYMTPPPEDKRGGGNHYIAEFDDGSGGK